MKLRWKMQTPDIGLSSSYSSRQICQRYFIFISLCSLYWSKKIFLPLRVCVKALKIGIPLWGLFNCKTFKHLFGFERNQHGCNFMCISHCMRFVHIKKFHSFFFNLNKTSLTNSNPQGNDTLFPWITEGFSLFRITLWSTQVIKQYVNREHWISFRFLLALQK